MTPKPTPGDLALLNLYCQGVAYDAYDVRPRLRALLDAYEALAQPAPSADSAALEARRDVERVIRCVATLLRASYGDTLTDDQRDGWRTIAADAKDSADALATALRSVVRENRELKARVLKKTVYRCPTCDSESAQCDCLPEPFV